MAISPRSAPSSLALAVFRPHLENGLSVAVGLTTWVPGLAAGPGALSAPAVAAGPVAGLVRAPGAEELAASVVALTAPEMEGRGSGTMGGDRAARYLADRLAGSGFRPGGDAGTYFSWFAVGSTARAGAGTMPWESGPMLRR